MLNKLGVPLFGKKKLLLSLEYGMTISEVAKDMKVEMTKEIMERAEEVIISEFQSHTPYELARDMGQNILAIFQPEN